MKLIVGLGKSEKTNLDNPKVAEPKVGCYDLNLSTNGYKTLEVKWSQEDAVVQIPIYIKPLNDSRILVATKKGIMIFPESIFDDQTNKTSMERYDLPSIVSQDYHFIGNLEVIIKKTNDKTDECIFWAFTQEDVKTNQETDKVERKVFPEGLFILDKSSSKNTTKKLITPKELEYFKPESEIVYLGDSILYYAQHRFMRTNIHLNNRENVFVAKSERRFDEILCMSPSQDADRVYAIEYDTKTRKNRLLVVNKSLHVLNECNLGINKSIEDRVTSMAFFTYSFKTTNPQEQDYHPQNNKYLIVGTTQGFIGLYECNLDDNQGELKQLIGGYIIEPKEIPLNSSEVEQNYNKLEQDVDKEVRDSIGQIKVINKGNEKNGDAEQLLLSVKTTIYPIDVYRLFHLYNRKCGLVHRLKEDRHDQIEFRKVKYDFGQQINRFDVIK